MKNIQIFFSILCFFILTSCNATNFEDNDDSTLYRVKIGDKYGFINEKGKIIIEPQFDDASITFSDNLCFAKIKDKAGFINKHCDFLIEFTDSVIGASPFEKGLAIVLLANNKYNIVNKDGEYLLSEFASVVEIITDNNEPYILVKSQSEAEQDSLALSINKRWYICDSEGNQIGERYDSISGFSEGLCDIKFNDKWGYINLKGNEVIEPQYDSAHSFSKEGLAHVNYNNKESFIDKEGNVVISADKILTRFNCNRAAIEINNKKYLIDRECNKTCQIKADSIYPFGSDSLSTIIKNGCASKIDTCGKIILSTKYQEISHFVKNLAFIKKNDKIGVINRNGKEIIKPSYSHLMQLSFKKYGISKNQNVIVLANKKNSNYEVSYFDFDGNLIGKDMPSENIGIPNNPTKKDFYKYFDLNLSNLDPIEGLYYVTIENYYQNRTNPDIYGLNNSNSIFYAVVRSSSDNNDFDVYLADGSGMWWVNKFIKINDSNQYGIMQNDNVRQDDHKYSSEGKLTLEDPYNFKFRLEQSHNDNYNFFVTYEFTKDYPPVSEIEKVQQVEWTGSGFAIADGYIATNYHVTNGAKQISIRGINGDTNKSYKGKVVASDRDNDLAIIRIVDKDYEGMESIPYSLGKNMVDIGEDVFVLGYPIIEDMGKDIKVTEGIISASSGYKGNSMMYQISAPVQPGNSGGPLFNDKGSVIGVVCAKLEDAENVNYAVKISQLHALINSSDLGIKITNNTLKENKRSKIVKQVKDFVYLIECSSR